MTHLDPASPGPPRPDVSGRAVTVALVGPDGAGKSTIAAEVAKRLPMPARVVYMGVNLEASGVMLPTTRLALWVKRRRGGGSDMTARAASGRPPLGKVRSVVRMLNWLAEEAYRQVLVGRMRRRGRVVILDRDFFCDYYASTIAGPSRGRPIEARLHGFVLRRWYRRPDLTIMLDAPPSLLLERKGQDDLAGLARRRQEYLDLAAVLPAFEVVDSTRPLDVVAEDVVARIVAFADPTHRGEEPTPAGDGSDQAQDMTASTIEQGALPPAAEPPAAEPQVADRVAAVGT